MFSPSAGWLDEWTELETWGSGRNYVMGLWAPVSDPTGVFMSNPCAMGADGTQVHAAHEGDSRVPYLMKASSTSSAAVHGIHETSPTMGFAHLAHICPINFISVYPNFFIDLVHFVIGI